MGIYKMKPNTRKYSRVANNEFELCKFTCVHLTSDWFKNNRLLSELTHAHYREPVPLIQYISKGVCFFYSVQLRLRCGFRRWLIVRIQSSVLQQLLTK